MKLYLSIFYYTFLHFKRRPNDAKNKKKCKINSRNFTYDGLTFSSLFLLESGLNLINIIGLCCKSCESSINRLCSQLQS
jgi:hypothetical protein